MLNIMTFSSRRPFAGRPLVAAAALAFAATVTAHSPAPAARAADVKSAVAAPQSAAAAANAAARRAAEDLTLSLIDASARFAAAEPGERGRLLSDLIAIAKSRRDALVDAIEADPATVLRVALPADVRAGLPGEAALFVEQETDEEGALEVVHVDYADSAYDHYEYHLSTAHGRLSLHFAADPPTLATGTKVQVHGVRIGDALAADSGATTVTMKAATLANTLGSQNTLAILVNWSDAPTQPYTLAQAQTVMFSTTSNYDYEASYQQTWLTGDVAGWFTIASTSTSCDYMTIASQAKQKATAAGYVLSNYARLVYVFPANACGWWGLGTVGGSPSEAWIHTKWGFTLPVVGHEMGHNLGLYHSHSLDCGGVALASSGCTASEYGDYFDLMGNGGNTPHYNAFQKERLGWLNAGVSPPLVTVTPQAGTRTFTIAPAERARDATPRALKIARTDACSSAQEWIYVESRQAVGFDAFVGSNANVLSGVLVHKVSEGNADSSYLLDLTPATASWTDPALAAGQSFVDSTLGLTITPVSVTSSGATVNVSYAGATCTHAGPVVALSPTGTRWSTPGASVGYTVTVTNKDGCGCPASTFDVSAAIPAGWAATGGRTASLAPGTSGSVSIAVTSATSASAGFYPLPVAAANSSAPTSTSSVSSTIAIASAIAVAVSTDKATYTLPARRNQTSYVPIKTHVTSSATAVSGASVSVQVRDPAGSVTTLAGTTNATGDVTVSYPLRQRSSPLGTYAVTSTATVGATSGVGAASFGVQ